MAVPTVIVPTLVAYTRNRIRSPAENAVSVGFPTHVIPVSDMESNSTPSSKGPPASSVIVGVPGVYLKRRYLPPALSLAFDSMNGIEMSVVVSVNPADSGFEIHATVEPPPVSVHWMFVPPLVRLTVSVVPGPRVSAVSRS